MAKVLAFQLRLKLVTAYSQSGIAYGQKTTVIMIDSVMSRCRLVNH